MTKTETKFNKLLKACESITDDEMKDMLAMAEGQANYISPLKGAKQKRLNETGEYNKRVLNALSDLRNAFKSHAR